MSLREWEIRHNGRRRLRGPEDGPVEQDLRPVTIVSPGRKWQVRDNIQDRDGLAGERNRTCGDRLNAGSEVSQGNGLAGVGDIGLEQGL